MHASAAEQKLLYCNTIENLSLFFKSEFEYEGFGVVFFLLLSYTWTRNTITL